MTDPGPPDPTLVGRFRVLSRIADGRTGRVLLGLDGTDREVAITLVAPGIAADPGFARRFQHEAVAAAVAPPWFLAPVLDADPAAEEPYLVTAFVDGPTLADYVAERGPLGPEGVRALASRMADGLAALHACGLVHSDLDPRRVVLAEDGPRLIDVAIARAAGLPGDPAFTSPEQASGVPQVTSAADLFGFGCLLLFAATGRSPFRDATVPATLHHVVYGEPDLGPLQPPVRGAVAECLRKDPARRASANRVRELLAGAGGPVAAPGMETPTELVPTASGELGSASPIVPEHIVLAPALITPEVFTPADEPPAREPRRHVPLVAIAAAIVLTAAVAVGALLFLRGGAGSTVVAAGPPPVGPAPTATVAPSASSSASGDPVAGAVVVDATADPRFTAGSARFASPTRNITCSMADARVRCDVLQRSWSVPPSPASCQDAYGNGVQLDRGATAALTCGAGPAASTTVLLDYDTGVRLGDLVCVSRQTGVQCQDERTGHGFRVSKATYDLY